VSQCIISISTACPGSNHDAASGRTLWLSGWCAHAGALEPSLPGSTARQHNLTSAAFPPMWREHRQLGKIVMWWSLLTILGVLLVLALATSGDA
jgi:hypothetical protein